MTSVARRKPKHLIVLQHGYCAHWIRVIPFFLTFKKKCQQHQEHDCIVHIARNNSSDYMFGFYRTQDGINQGGKRLANEIQNIIQEFPSIKYLSLIGGSLGGLYVRYALHELYNQNNQNFFHNLQILNVIMLGTPHLGCDDWVQHSQLYSLAKKLQKYRLLPLTLQQLLKLDNHENTNQTLLHIMANDNSFLEPLKKCYHPVIYANSLNDNRVSCSSAAILPLFGFANETKMINDIIKNIKIIKNDNYVIKLNIDENKWKEILLNTNNNDNNNIKNGWYSLLNEIFQHRYLVNVNSNRIMNQFAHTLLAAPIEQLEMCKILIEQIFEDFIWDINNTQLQ